MEVQEREIQPLAVGLKKATTLTDLCVRTLRYYIASGDIPVFRVGRKVLIPVANLQQFIETRQHPSPSKAKEMEN